MLSNTSRQTVAEEKNVDLLPKEAIQNKFEFGLKMGGTPGTANQCKHDEILIMIEKKLFRTSRE